MLKGTLFYELYQLIGYWKKTKSRTTMQEVLSEKVYYGEHSSQYLIIYSPRQVDPEKPLIIYYHGGGWIFGNPDLFVKKASLFTSLGYQVIMPCYRKVPIFHADHILEDVKLMLGTVKELAEQKKISTLDKIILGGVSAGANLVALIYFQNQLREKAGFTQDQFCGMFLYAPPLDLSKMKSTPVLYRFAGSKDSERFRRASPILHIKDSLPIPILCIHGKLDALVQFDASQTFRSQYEELHPGFLEYVTLEDASHIDAASWAHTDDDLRKGLVQWLDKVSKGSFISPQ